MPSPTSGSPVRMAGFAAAAMIAILLEVAPLGLSADAAPAPDLVAAVVFYWALRRPESAPLLLVLIVAAARDFLAGGPVGPGALALVLGAEALRGRRGAHTPLHVEFALFAIFIMLTGLGVWLMVWVTASGAPAISSVLARAALTLVCYPFVYFLLRRILMIRSFETAERRASRGFR